MHLVKPHNISKENKIKRDVQGFIKDNEEKVGVPYIINEDRKSVRMESIPRTKRIAWIAHTQSPRTLGNRELYAIMYSTLQAPHSMSGSSLLHKVLDPCPSITHSLLERRRQGWPPGCGVGVGGGILAY